MPVATAVRRRVGVAVDFRCALNVGIDIGPKCVVGTLARAAASATTDTLPAHRVVHSSSRWRSCRKKTGRCAPSCSISLHMLRRMATAPFPPRPNCTPPIPPSPPSPEPQQVVPAMGMGAFPYHGGHFPPMMPPPNAYAGGFAVGAPQGTPSDAFSRRKGGWRGGNRPETANKKDEKKKGKARDVLAADPSGVQKPGKHHDKNVKHRKKVQAEKQKKKEKGVQEGGEGEQEVEMSGVEDASNPGTQPSGPPQPVVQQQQVAENSSASVGAAPADGTLAPSASRQIPNLPRRLREGEEE